MVSARNFRVGEMVRFKTEKEQVEAALGVLVPSPYRSVFGHICIVEALGDETLHNYGTEDDIVVVRSIGTGEIVKCYVHRLEKYNG